MTSKELIALVWGVEAARVTCDRNGRLAFTYASEWMGRDDALPISLSMPLGTATHSHARIDAYLWGLLPDNEVVLERWGARFQVSGRNAFGLVSHVGEDLAGAVQFVQPDRIDAIVGTGDPEIQWLTEADVEARLRELRDDQSAGRRPNDVGQFSLAGAQPKTAYHFRDGRFGVPAGRTPTTHILKPALRGRAGHVENEHICLALARQLGIPAAASEVRRFGEELAIVVTRFDRAPADGEDLGGLQRAPIIRLHQEDMCQALGLRPALKYEKDGGPSVRMIAELLREHSAQPREDVRVFVDALAFNWLVAGTDAHAKNYSVLHRSGGRVRLAPLYDLGSALLYDDIDLDRARLAMRIGAEYRIRDIRGRQWRKLAGELRVDVDETIARILDLAVRLPDAVSQVVARMIEDGLDAAVVRRLADSLTERAGICRTLVGETE